MNKSLVPNFRIEVKAGAPLILRNPQGRERMAIHGPAVLRGIKLAPEQDDDDWWVIFPNHRDFGLTAEEIIDAWLQKRVTAWDIRADGTEDLTFKETTG